MILVHIIIILLEISVGKSFLSYKMQSVHQRFSKIQYVCPIKLCVLHCINSRAHNQSRKWLHRTLFCVKCEIDHEIRVTLELENNMCQRLGKKSCIPIKWHEHISRFIFNRCFCCCKYQEYAC